MKNLFLLLFTLFLTNFGFSQTLFWTAYNFDVAPGQEQNFMNTLDQFFKSETGKMLPTVSVNSVFFRNSESNVTHQVIFGTPDKSAFGQMYSGSLNQSAEFIAMVSSLDGISDSGGSYLGKSIHYSPSPANSFRTILSLNVSNPAGYAMEFSKFKSNVEASWEGKVTMSLHQVLSGNEEDVTHIVVVTTPDFETMLDFSDKIYTSDDFGEFASKVSSIRKVVSNNTVFNLAVYNAPEN